MAACLFTYPVLFVLFCLLLFVTFLICNRYCAIMCNHVQFAAMKCERVSLLVVSSSETKRQMASHHRCVAPQHVAQCQEVQDGHAARHQTGAHNRLVGHQCGLQRCLPPHTDSPATSPVSGFPSGGKEVLVQSEPFRARSTAAGVHRNLHGTQSVCATEV